MASISGRGTGSRISVDVGLDTGDRRLKANALTLWDSTVMAVTSTAPTYSMASTMFLMAAAVGLATPATLLVCFFFVLGIAIAYAYMNSTNPNCGASYAWLTQAISPFLGWFTGWAQLIASLLFLVTGPVLAGTNTLAFLHSIGLASAGASSNAWAVALVGVVWLVVVTAMVVYGIQITARFQMIMLIIEYLALLVFAGLAFIKVATSHPVGSLPFSWQWLNPFSIHDIGTFAAGAVLAVFFFWGWDTAANVNEETDNARLNPGRAGIIGMVLLLIVFLVSGSAMQSLLPQKTFAQQGANSLQYFANAVVPAPWSYVMLLALLSSTVAVLQTTLLPASRLTLAMARDGVWPRLFAHIHPRFQTPWIGTIVLAILCVAGVLLTTGSPSVSATLSSLTSNIGVLVAFYYGITGFACIWYFRRLLLRSWVTLVFAGIVPLVSGVFLFWVGAQVVLQGQQSSGWASVLPVLIVFALGVPLTLWAWAVNRRYFAYRPEAYDPDVEYVGPVRDGRVLA